MNLTEQFSRQVLFIERSSASYDQGHNDEALRIAVALRVLIHDTSKSTSLLTQLGVKNKILLSTTIGTGKTREQCEGKLFYTVPLMISLEGVKPLLDKATSEGMLPVEEWWNEVIMIQNGIFTRKDIILAAANQDGGAHVDDNPSNKTKKLKAGVGTFTRTIKGKEIVEELTDHHFPMIRQFAHEVLSSSGFMEIAKDT